MQGDKIRQLKCIYNFCKVRGLIDRFNESRRQIASGVKKTVDESMSSILFHNTPKGYLLHYSYIFKKPDPLGTEMNNADFSRLGSMLHLEIQKREEDMQTSTFKCIYRRDCSGHEETNDCYKSVWPNDVK